MVDHPAMRRAIVAVRFGSDQGWPMPTAFNAAPAFVALALVGPVAKWIDLRRSPRPSTAHQ